MISAVLEATRQINLLEEPVPQPGPEQVLVRVAYTGVCGSDVPRFLQGAVHRFPQVLGHEFSGTVAAIGEGVNPELLGKLVAGIPLVPCMECPDCEAGNFSLCKHYSFIGSRQPGSMASHVMVPASNVFPVDPEVKPLDAAFFEPATVALHAIELVAPRPGASAIVLGGGTIGILLAQALKGYGIDRVVVTKSREETFGPARAAGITSLVATNQENWQQRAFELGDCQQAKGFDYVFDTAGTPQTILDAFEMAANKAAVMFVGTPKQEVSFSVREWENINRKELLVSGSWMSYSAPWPGVEWEKASRFFAQGILRVVPEMIDTIYPLDRTQEALERFAQPHGICGKIVIDSRGGND